MKSIKQMISSNYWCLYNTYILRLFVIDGLCELGGFSYWNYLMNMFLARQFLRKHTLVTFNRKLHVVHIKDILKSFILPFVCLKQEIFLYLFIWFTFLSLYCKVQYSLCKVVAIENTTWFRQTTYQRKIQNTSILCWI